MRYLVPDNSHVDPDTPFAEVEVMKMCMPLLSPASGEIQFKMAEGQAMQVSIEIRNCICCAIMFFKIACNL